MDERIDRDELARLHEIERRARALFMQTPPLAVAAHVAVAVSAPADGERLEALERALLLAGSLAGGANDKLLRRVYALKQALNARG